MKHTTIILNASAGAALGMQDQIRRLAKRMRCGLRLTKAPGDAKRQARKALESGAERIIVAGGDGTLSQVINGLAPDFAQVELAVVPLGTGNDFARSLDIPTGSIETTMSLATTGVAQPIDLVRLEDGVTSYLVNAAMGGFCGKVAADLDRADKVRWGAFAYWITAIRELASLQELQIELNLDGQTQPWDVYGLAIANGRYVGGGFPIAPTAFLNDGLLEVTLMRVLPATELMAAGLDYMLGIANETNRVPTLRGRRLSFTAKSEIPFSIDGEPKQEAAVTFEVLPRVLRVVTGHAPLCLAPDNSLGQEEVWATPVNLAAV